MIPYGKQTIRRHDIDAVAAALSDDFLTQGPRVVEFEKQLAAHAGAKYAVVVNSATSALHLACLALGVERGDTVWTSAISFVASANAAKYCDANVDFVDIDPLTFNMCPSALERKLESTLEAGEQLPKVVIPVSMAGQSWDVESIYALSQKFGFQIIEDNSHALGATHLGRKLGSCAFSSISVFSFHPVKMITTGEGGACTTNDPVIAKRIARLRAHGITRDFDEMASPSDVGYYYEQLDLGFNYRITDFQCALGMSQLESLDEFISRRREVVDYYEKNLDTSRFVLPTVGSGNSSSWHLYVVRLVPEMSVLRDKLFRKFRASDVLVNLHYIPIYRHPYYWNSGLYSFVDYPEAEAYYRAAISLPIFPEISLQELDFVCQIANDAIYD